MHGEGHYAKSEDFRLQIVDLGLRNWEPARRVGVRRTIADFKKEEDRNSFVGAAFSRDLRV